jgi:transposase-like protein
MTSAANNLAMVVDTSDPKPEKRASDKLSLERQAWSCGRDRGGHAGGEEGTYGRADLAGLAPGGGWHQSADICREHGISEATFYIWKKKYSGLGLSELRELRQLREENSKLKHSVADLSLDRHIL